MILLDTMVLSELRKSRPNRGVVSFIKNQADGDLFVSVLTIGEIEAGIERQRAANPEFASELAAWLAQTEVQFAHCILPVTPPIAKLWGRLCVQTGNAGIDNLIAATALCHNLTVATRNLRHFAQTRVQTLNPFSSGQ
jgi:toxin FitB